MAPWIISVYRWFR